jgi:hypothetical protein
MNKAKSEELLRLARTRGEGIRPGLLEYAKSSLAWFEAVQGVTFEDLEDLRSTLRSEGPSSDLAAYLVTLTMGYLKHGKEKRVLELWRSTVGPMEKTYESNHETQ